MFPFYIKQNLLKYKEQIANKNVRNIREGSFYYIILFFFLKSICIVIGVTAGLFINYELWVVDGPF